MNIRKISISIVAGVIAALTAASAAAAPDVALVRERAEQGVVESQFALGNMYFKGNGVEQNIEEALKWYRRAAEKATPWRSSSSASSTRTAGAFLRTRRPPRTGTTRHAKTSTSSAATMSSASSTKVFNESVEYAQVRTSPSF